MAAWSLVRSHSYLGAYLRRQRARLGAPKAITATAHKLARILYNLMRHGIAYMKKEEAAYAEQVRGLMAGGVLYPHAHARLARFEPPLINTVAVLARSRPETTAPLLPGVDRPARNRTERALAKPLTDPDGPAQNAASGVPSTFRSGRP